MLDALVAASGVLSVSGIAEAVGVDQPRASRLVQQAVQLGLVVREPDPDDARRTRVRLTPEGEGLVSGVRGRRRDAVRSALESFSAEESREFARLLGKFADAWPRD
jgi:DNA-binding MarR family transcriptional regulator